MIHGTYGKSNFLNLPFRTDKGGGKADFITVGKIDNGRAGPFSEKRGIPYSEMLRKWLLMGESAKKAELENIFYQEKQKLPVLFAEWGSKHVAPPVVEIANEPNIFPYLPPEMYAEYYSMWWKEVKQLRPGAVIMNGGLWVNDVLPKKITKLLPLIGIKETNTMLYYQKFLESVDSKMRPDILNLHYYPFTGSPRNVPSVVDKTEFKKITIKPIWITEYGNINPFNMEQTAEFIRNLKGALPFTLSSVERMYYFQTKYSESHFQLFHQLKRRYDKKKGFRRIVRWVSKLTNKNSVPGILARYTKNPPIQNLEDESGLNDIGGTF